MYFNSRCDDENNRWYWDFQTPWEITNKHFILILITILSYWREGSYCRAKESY